MAFPLLAAEIEVIEPNVQSDEKLQAQIKDKIEGIQKKVDVQDDKSRALLNYGLAQMLCKSAIKNGEKNTTAYLEAVAFLDLAIELDPSTAKQHYERAFCKYNINDFAGARADYEQEIILNHSDELKAKSLYGIGCINLKTNDTIAAVQCFKESAAIFADEDILAKARLQTIANYHWNRVSGDHDPKRSTEEMISDLKVVLSASEDQDQITQSHVLLEECRKAVEQKSVKAVSANQNGGIMVTEFRQLDQSRNQDKSLAA